MLFATSIIYFLIIAGIPVSHQNLLHQQAELDDQTVLKDVPIYEGIRLKLIPSMRVGPIQVISIFGLYNLIISFNNLQIYIIEVTLFINKGSFLLNGHRSCILAKSLLKSFFSIPTVSSARAAFIK